MAENWQPPPTHSNPANPSKVSNVYDNVQLLATPEHPRHWISDDIAEPQHQPERKDIIYVNGYAKINRDNLGTMEVLSLWFDGEEPVIHVSQVLPIVLLLSWLRYIATDRDVQSELSKYFISLLSAYQSHPCHNVAKSATLHAAFKSYVGGQGAYHGVVPTAMGERLLDQLLASEESFTRKIWVRW